MVRFRRSPSIVDEPHEKYEFDKKGEQTYREKIENSLDEELQSSHISRAKGIMEKTFQQGILGLILGEAQKSRYGFEKAGAFAATRLETIRTLQRAGEELGYGTNVPESAEDGLWLATITGNDDYADRAMAVAREYTEADAKALEDPEESGFALDRFHRMRAVLATIEDDPETAREHVQWLREDASGGRYRDDYHDEYPKTLPLLNVLEAILDRDWERFRGAFEEYLAATLREHESSSLPIEDSKVRYFTISIVGLLVLGYRRGLDLTTVDPQRLPDDIATVETHLLPEEVLTHDWPVVEHEPSELAQQLTQKIADFEAQLEDEPKADTDDEPGFESGGELTSPEIETVVWPDSFPYRYKDYTGRESLSVPYGMQLLMSVDYELHEGDRASPAFEFGVGTDFLHRGLGPLTAVAERLYFVVTDTAVAVLTEFGADRFGLLYIPWMSQWTLEKPGVVELDPDALWEAVTTVTETMGGASFYMDGTDQFHVVPQRGGNETRGTADPIGALKELTEQSEFSEDPVEVERPPAPPADAPEPGGLTTLLTGVEDDSGDLGWSGPPSTRLLVGDPSWLERWLVDSQAETMRLRAGLVNDGGTPGDGVAAVSDPSGKDLVRRSGASLAPSDTLSQVTDPLAGVVWPTREGSDAAEAAAEAFDPDTGTISPGSIGTVADAGYDAESLEQFFRGFYQGPTPGMWVTVGEEDRLRVEAELTESQYLLYEQSPIQR
jgi:hypothetical protein